MKDINEKSTTMNKLLLGLIFTILLCASCTNRGMVAIDNGIVKLEFVGKRSIYTGCFSKERTTGLGF